MERKYDELLDYVRKFRDEVEENTRGLDARVDTRKREIEALNRRCSGSEHSPQVVPPTVFAPSSPSVQVAENVTPRPVPQPRAGPSSQVSFLS